jgi:hypothetical protein
MKKLLFEKKYVDGSKEFCENAIKKYKINNREYFLCLSEVNRLN